MRNYVVMGPVRIKVSNKHLAQWGFPLVDVGGLAIWSWTNSGEWVPLSYHPSSSITWLWSLSFSRRPTMSAPVMRHNFGGSREWRLPFGVVLHYRWQKRMDKANYL